MLHRTSTAFVSTHVIQTFLKNPSRPIDGMHSLVGLSRKSDHDRLATGLDVSRDGLNRWPCDSLSSTKIESSPAHFERGRFYFANRRTLWLIVQSPGGRY